jgi:hypothetical protein
MCVLFSCPGGESGQAVILPDGPAAVKRSAAPVTIFPGIGFGYLDHPLEFTAGTQDLSQESQDSYDAGAESDDDEEFHQAITTQGSIGKPSLPGCIGLASLESAYQCGPIGIAFVC